MTTKRKRKSDVPLTRCSGTMTESQFWSFIRSALRSKSLRWKPISDCLQAATRPYKGVNRRQKKEAQCAMCRDWFKLSDVVVDHQIACGSLKCAEDVGGFVERLFCEAEGLRVLCEDCHRYVTYSQNNNCSLEEARAKRPEIEFLKLTATEQRKLLTGLGASSNMLTNEEKRLQVFREINKEKSMISERIQSAKERLAAQSISYKDFPNIPLTLHCPVCDEETEHDLVAQGGGEGVVECLVCKNVRSIK